MSGFKFDIQGQLNNLQLATSKALWPLFEAVINAIQAIEDAKPPVQGSITIQAHREEKPALLFDDSAHQERIHAFTITDNGVGMNSANYNSFNTAYSQLKLARGCKGIGRFLWLKAFSKVKIQSVFFESEKYYERQYQFTVNGNIPEDNVRETNKTVCGTSVFLEGYLDKYKKAAPVDLNVIAKKLIEHCLVIFVSGNVPQIILTDGVEKIDLNQYFNEIIKPSLIKDDFDIQGVSFSIYHLKLPEGETTHRLHLCANKQDVDSVDLKRYMPEMQKKIEASVEDGGSFYYVGYVTSPYLDSLVNTTRTAFDFEESDEEESLFDSVKKKDILEEAIKCIRKYLSTYLDLINDKKKREIDEFVSYERPTYRFLLNNKPGIYNSIPAGLKKEDLELELHKQAQKWETEVFESVQKIEQAITDNEEIEDYEEVFQKYWGQVTDVSRLRLAEYVTKRRTVLTLLDKILTVNDNGKFSLEKVIHSLICPMVQTSDTVPYEAMNLWIIDERLAYHTYLASDKTLRSIPLLESNSRREPDLAIFNSALAYSDSDEPFNTITIIEFKKPDNDAHDPITQVYDYIDLIREGRKKKNNGQAFIINEGTVFRCYIICDLTNKMKKYCSNADFLPTADNLGYTGNNRARNAYIEVISYSKLLADAKKRNQIFFDKLFNNGLHGLQHIE